MEITQELLNKVQELAENLTPISEMSVLLDIKEDVWVGVGNNPGGAHNENHADSIQFTQRHFGFVTFITELQNQTPQPLHNRGRGHDLQEYGCNTPSCDESSSILREKELCLSSHLCSGRPYR